MEENKVAQKLTDVIHEQRRWFSGFGTECVAATIADAILQSPDLRVTLRESKHYILRSQINDDFSVYKRQAHEFDEWCGKFPSESAANDYITWMNSKEPK